MALYKKVLARATTRLLSDLDPMTLLDYLIEKEIFSHTEVRDIQEQTTTTEKTRKIIEQFKMRDDKSYYILKQCLIKSNQKHLADYLNSLEIEVKKEEANFKPALPQAMENLQLSDEKLPTDKELMDIAKCIGLGWEFLAVQLRLPLVEVDRIKIDYKGALKQIFQMLVKWKSQPNATLPSLFAAMYKVRTITRIDDLTLENKFGSDIFKVKPTMPALYSVPQSINKHEVRPESSISCFRPNTSVTVQLNTNNIVSQSTERSNGVHMEDIGKLGQTQPCNSNSDDIDLSQKVNDMNLGATNETSNADLQHNINMGLDVTDAKALNFINDFTNETSNADLQHNVNMGLDVTHAKALNFINDEKLMVQPVEFFQNVTSTDLAVNDEERPTESPGNLHLVTSNTKNIKSSSGHEKHMQQNQSNAESSELFDRITKDLGTLKNNYMPKNTSENSAVHQKSVPSRVSSFANSECQPNKVFKTSDQITYKKCFHDGRLIHLNPDQLATVKKDVKKIGEGGFGEVYLVKSGVVLDIQMVLKTIKCGPDDAEKVKSFTNEKLSARIMHFAVVPLIAVAENTLTDNEKIIVHYHFMSPYLPEGSLLDKIKKDNMNMDKVCLSRPDRIRILYHIASAIEFLHTPVNSLRNAVHHRDITSNNIVIDGNLNARLIDFGLAYEIKEGSARRNTTMLPCHTPGYTGDDYKDFGIVIRELLTGKEAKDDEEQELINYSPDCIRRFVKKSLWYIWCSDKNTEYSHEAKKLNELSQNCIDTKVKNLSESLWKLISSSGLPMWERNDDTNKCEVCMVNPTAPDTLQEGKCNAAQHIKVCIACLRNSYLNPVKCHSCQKVLQPTIGYQWGALLIAGGAYRSNKKEAESFYSVVQTLKNILVSKSPLIMGLQEDNVVTVVPDNEASMKDRLSNKFSFFKNKKDVKKLIIYFCGHHSNGFLLDKEDDYSKDDLQKEIKTLHENGIEKFQIILDCCHAPGIETPSAIDLTDENQKISIYQINACEPYQTSMRDFDGGIFSKLLFQALRGESVKQECFVTQKKQGIREACAICTKFQMQNKQNCYITFDNLHEYLHNHYDEIGKIDILTNVQKPVVNGVNVGWKETVFAYYVDLEMLFRFLIKHDDNKDYPYEVLPREFNNFEELQVLLFEKFKEVMNLPKLDTTDFKDIIRIIIRHAKKSQPRDEINTYEQLISAWNAHMDELYVTLRDIKNITKGRVGHFLPKGNANTIFQIFQGHGKIFTQSRNEYSHTMQVKINALDEMSQLLDELHVDFDKEFLFDIITTIQQEVKKQDKEKNQEERDLYSHLEILFPNDEPYDKSGKPRNDFMCFKLCKI